MKHRTDHIRNEALHILLVLTAFTLLEYLMIPLLQYAPVAMIMFQAVLGLGLLGYLLSLAYRIWNFSQMGNIS